MERLRMIVLLVVLVASLALLCVGLFVTEHEFYAQVDRKVERFKTSDPIRIREWSFA
jgi:hypothetical protein